MPNKEGLSVDWYKKAKFYAISPSGDDVIKDIEYQQQNTRLDTAKIVAITDQGEKDILFEFYPEALLMNSTIFNALRQRLKGNTVKQGIKLMETMQETYQNEASQMGGFRD